MEKINKKQLVVFVFFFLFLSLILHNFFAVVLLVILGFFFVKNFKNISNKIGIGSIFNNKYNLQENMETINPNKYSPKRLGSFFLLIFSIVILLSFASSFWVVIGAGETGVSSLFGKVMDDEMSSGFHLKNPLVKVTKMNIRTNDYTMSVTQGEGVHYGDDAITALTKEGLSVNLDITVLYHLVEEKASDVYRDLGLGYEESIIRPQIRSMIREVVASYNVKDIYSEKRLEVANSIADRLKQKFDSRGIALEDVLLRHVELPANLADSIQQKLQAEQEAERYDFLLVTEQKEAERKRIEAEGQRDSQKIISESLSQSYLDYLYISSLKDREGTIYVPTNPNNGVPLFRGL